MTSFSAQSASREYNRSHRACLCWGNRLGKDIWTGDDKRPTQEDSLVGVICPVGAVKGELQHPRANYVSSRLLSQFSFWCAAFPLVSLAREVNLRFFVCIQRQQRPFVFAEKSAAIITSVPIPRSGESELFPLTTADFPERDFRRAAADSLVRGGLAQDR